MTTPTIAFLVFWGVVILIALWFMFRKSEVGEPVTYEHRIFDPNFRAQATAEEMQSAIADWNATCDPKDKYIRTPYEGMKLGSVREGGYVTQSPIKPGDPAPVGLFTSRSLRPGPVNVGMLSTDTDGPSPGTIKAVNDLYVESKPASVSFEAMKQVLNEDFGELNPEPKAWDADEVKIMFMNCNVHIYEGPFETTVYLSEDAFVKIAEYLNNL
jgi:hypothetical protein